MAKLMRTFPELMLIVKARTKVGIIGQLVVQGCVGQCIGVMGFIYIYMLHGSESNRFASSSSVFPQWTLTFFTIPNPHKHLHWSIST